MAHSCDLVDIQCC